MKPNVFYIFQTITHKGERYARYQGQADSLEGAELIAAALHAFLMTAGFTAWETVAVVSYSAAGRPRQHWVGTPEGLQVQSLDARSHRERAGAWKVAALWRASTSPNFSASSTRTRPRPIKKARARAPGKRWAPSKTPRPTFALPRRGFATTG